jgi:hypothetical protein
MAIENPGSAIGEAIGAEMEKALNLFLSELVGNNGYHYICKSPTPGKKKLLMYDLFKTAYNIDAVITNESMQPLILVESKYLRYKKHNRDKGSWICTAHPAIRRNYNSIRSSIAVLAGNWRGTSLTMIKSYGINIFLIPFDRICSLLLKRGIAFDWEEKDRNAANAAWELYCQLTSNEKEEIGKDMINDIKLELQNLVVSILDNELKRDIEKVVIELYSNLGEVKVYEFQTIENAVSFLNNVTFPNAFTLTDSLSLFDTPNNSENNNDEDMEKE